MKTLYIECNMGAAGDMLMAALSDLVDDPQGFIDRMNGLGLPGTRLERLACEKCGVTGTRIAVVIDGEEEHCEDVNGDAIPHAHDHPHDHDHDHHAHDHSTLHSPLSTLDHPHHHHHATLADVRGIIDALPLPERVRADANAVYARIADAESRVHGHPIDQIHFHEVGTLDAIADVVGVCALMHEIAPERVVVSPVHVGCGEVRCAHGVLPVPSPATALLLEGMPIYGGAIRGELCTPTGAALLRHFADAFGDMPAMTLRRTGVGMGMKDFAWTNCVRAMLGDTREAPDAAVQLECNLDDMTGEEIGHAANLLRGAGALDAWTQPIQMKKDRPGTLLCALCPPGREAEFAELMLKHTSTIGVRCHAVRRYTLQREAVTYDSPWGPVRGKRSRGFGVCRVKPEFDDVAAIARREGLTPRQVLEKLTQSDE